LKGKIMKKILIVTVGGSPQPIITSINTTRPGRVIFICSGGANSSKPQVAGPIEAEKAEKCPNCKCPLKETAKPTSIVEKTGIAGIFDCERDIFIAEDPDDLASCYMASVRAIESAKQDCPGCEIYTDYTGGTKTMTGGLLLASIDCHVEPLVTSGPRDNLRQVTQGESTRKVSASSIRYRRMMDTTIPSLLQRFDYQAAGNEIRNIQVEIALPPEETMALSNVLAFCQCFEQWDQFDHNASCRYLKRQAVNEEMLTYYLFCKKVQNCRKLIDLQYEPFESMGGHGYEIIQDLLLNAERRAAQGRFDDAVGRIYRALELTAQIRLLSIFGIRTGDVDIEKLPEHLREYYEGKRNVIDKKIKLGLTESFALLAKFPDDDLGKLYNIAASDLMNSLHFRNDSIFAHGFKAIREKEYGDFGKVVIPFIENCIKTAAGAKSCLQQPGQFPQSFIEFVRPKTT